MIRKRAETHERNSLHQHRRRRRIHSKRRRRDLSAQKLNNALLFAAIARSHPQPAGICGSGRSDAWLRSVREEDAVFPGKLFENYGKE